MNPAVETLNAQQERGTAAFAASGLPTRRDEAWRYTPVAGLGIDPGHMGDACPEVDAGQCTDGVTLQSLASALDQDDGRLAGLLDALDLQGAANSFNALSQEALRNGLVVTVADGQDGGRLTLDWHGHVVESDGTPRFANARLFVLLGAGARLALSESFLRLGEDRALNLVTQVQLGEGASLVHSRLQDAADSASLITRTIVDQAANSEHHYTGLDLGGALVRHDLQARLQGEGARCAINGAYLTDGRSHVDNHLEIEHQAPNCHSSQFFRGVMRERSKAVFNGRVHVHPGADGTEALQSNANLLLSDLAEIYTKPELEIEADEVVASHGATVGQLDEDAVFYLRSRGLDEAAARQVLTSAFCQAAIDAMPDDELRPVFTEALSQHLETGS